MNTHSFHIPVMGTGFTIDTPLKVARYGISSVVSLADDKLIEKIRRYYCGLYRENYVPISETEPDYRARRITEYLNFIDRTAQRQIQEIKASPFEKGSEISKYFELMSDHSPVKQKYLEMLSEGDSAKKRVCQDDLRAQVVPGAIDVNIMTKVDKENYANGEKMPREYSDALAGLRGFAQSSLNSSIVFSAGLGLHLYSYVSEFDDFYADETGEFKKRVVLKVSDFRSASIQAKFLAKRGVWVSEYRIESGLNCGGHAFPTTGHLFGPILEEFKEKKQELVDSLFAFYCEALSEKKKPLPLKPPALRVTAQGGVGTWQEHQLLLEHFEISSVGWGSPFLLVPETTALDAETLGKLAKAGPDDIYLSNASPLGIQFYNLRNSSSEETRKERIAAGHPGSPCLSKFLTFNTEYGRPLCAASSQYQNLKIHDLDEKKISPDEYAKAYERIVEKACICRDLGDGALLKYGIADEKKKQTPAVCPGPNLAFFSKIASLKEMIDHIYGRANILDANRPRPHLFINELKIYVNYLKNVVQRSLPSTSKKDAEYFFEFKTNLLSGIEYYKKLAVRLAEGSEQAREKFTKDLLAVKEELEQFVLSHAPAFVAAC